MILSLTNRDMIGLQCLINHIRTVQEAKFLWCGAAMLQNFSNYTKVSG